MNPRYFLIAIILASYTLVLSPAEARHRHHANHGHKHYAQTYKSVHSGLFDQAAIAPYPTEQTRQNRIIASPMGKRHIAPSNGYSMAEGIVGNPAGCPRTAFCGCAASVEVFGHPIRELYLAANWFRFAHASPAPGMVAVRNHHVFVIRQVNGDGTVLAYDGNSGGHKTRIHTVSLRGFSVRDPHSRQVASR